MSYDPKAAGEAKLTNVEIDMLQSMLNAHDRGGFYIAYAAMSGSKESELQASISTFSENVGGIALAANRITVTDYGDGVLNYSISITSECGFHSLPDQLNALSR